MEHFVSSAYWDHAYGDSGFAFRDSGGYLKDTLVPVFRSPLPTLLPARPTLFIADWPEGTLDLTFDCHEGGVLAVLLPGDGCSCTVPEGLSETEALPNHSAWICKDDGEIAVTCACL